MNNSKNTHEFETATLASPSGLRATIVNLGATLARLEVPVDGDYRNVVLAYDAPESYLTDRYYMGSTVGPFANRIRDARFELDGQEYVLDANEEASSHCLHGGSEGLDRQFFELESGDDGMRVCCRKMLPDGLGGLPGNRSIRVIYQMLSPVSLAIDFEATSDRDTIISLANHAYFNLGGLLSDHELAVYADAYTPVHAGNVPTGEIRSVVGTRFDLRKMAPLADQRFDHNFVLGDELLEPRIAARVQLRSTGLQLTVSTTLPGLQLFTGDALDEPFEPRQGLCLEAQRFPDAPNQPGFPSARLDAGEVYRQRTVYEFGFLND